jgi:hypothetical protein
MRINIWLKMVGALAVIAGIDAALVLSPSFQPVPWQGTQSAAQGADNVQQQSNGNPTPSTMPSGHNGLIQPNASNPDGDAVAGKDKQQQEYCSAPRAAASLDCQRAKEILGLPARLGAMDIQRHVGSCGHGSIAAAQTDVGSNKAPS